MGASDYLDFARWRGQHLLFTSAEARERVAVAEKQFAEELALAKLRCDEIAATERAHIKAWEHYTVPGDDGSNPFMERGPGWRSTPTVVFLAMEIVPYMGLRSFEVGVGRRQASESARSNELVAVYRVTYERSAKTGRPIGDRLNLRLVAGERVPTMVEELLEAEYLKRLGAVGSREDVRRWAR